MQPAKSITADAIMPREQYQQMRAAMRRNIIAFKVPRRIAVGPYATFYFENYTTMLQQIQEMLYIENGGTEQLADELAAYNPLIPQGRELTATLMFEIDDPVKRNKVLAVLTHIEHNIFIEIVGERITATPEEEVDRTKSDGKTSSVHFLHFAFSDAAIRAFKSEDARVMLGINHPHYTHMTILSPSARAVLGEDFD